MWVTQDMQSVSCLCLVTGSALAVWIVFFCPITNSGHTVCHPESPQPCLHKCLSTALSIGVLDLICSSLKWNVDWHNILYYCCYISHRDHELVYFQVPSETQPSQNALRQVCVCHVTQTPVSGSGSAERDLRHGCDGILLAMVGVIWAT